MNVDILFRNTHLATMTDGLGIIEDGALAASGGAICWMGKDVDIPPTLSAGVEIEGEGHWLLPGLIDCHTHLVWAGNRSIEFERRLTGQSYSDISQGGGGIQATVRATRKASMDELLASASERLRKLASEGVTTVEIKSGYGLDVETEMKMLAAARGLGSDHHPRIRTTYLGAHAVPIEYSGRADAYVDFICDEAMPTIHLAKLADAVDAFCEGIAFNLTQTRKVLETAKSLGLPVKMHADQLSDLGGSGLAAELGALSADHLEYASEESIRAMARAGTVAVLLPGAYYSLREPKAPDIPSMLRYGVPIAIASDCNPGTSPYVSLLLMLNMSCVLFRLTPAQALAGVTTYAAKALGLDDQLGSLQIGKSADLALFAIDHPRDLCASFGLNPCIGSWKAGNLVWVPG